MNIAKDGMVAAMGNGQTSTGKEPLSEGHNIHDKSRDNEMASDSEQDEHMATENSAHVPKIAAKPRSIRKCLENISQQSKISMWLMAYIAITTSWPLVGSALQFVFKNKFRSVLPAILNGR